MSFQIGDTIGDYEVVGLLGAGGMGKVYKVRNVISDRVEAAKVLMPDLEGAPDLADRFIREIKVHASLNHPNIAALHTALRIDNQLFMVMELLEGTTLDVRIGEAPVPVEEGVGYICQVLEALGYAHARGVVHRDIKPSNIMITPQGAIKLMDFGIARAVSQGQLTQPGMAIGSASYMAPEQVKGAPPDTRSDLYSLGVTLYEIVTGARPIQGENDYAIMTAQIQQLPRPPRELKPDLPPDLPEIMLKALAKNPADRFQTAHEFRASLMAVNAVRQARPVEPAPVVAVAAGSAVIGKRPRFVGRSMEIAGLMAAYASAASGSGEFLCISGGPGMGKTALAEAFLAKLRDKLEPFSLALGRCSERLSEAEPYRSVFEAIENLLSGADAEPLRAALAETAPTWLARLAGGADSGPASQERMIREATAFFRRASRLRPIILFIEDVQWADVSTVDLMLDLTSRLDDVRILVLCTYRPHERTSGEIAFQQLRLQLQRRGAFREIALNLLSVDECAALFGLAFPGARFPDGFSGLVRSKTAGNPLFLVELVEYFKDANLIVEDRAGWKLARPDLQLADIAPESVRAMIQAKLDQLSPEERKLLLAASVQGVDFDSAVVAKALGQDAADVEDALDAAQRTRGIVESAGEVELPDGTLAVRYRFVQDPDHEALFAELKPARRAPMSAAIAGAMAEFHGRQPRAAAARIALLFETARKFGDAAEYFRLAAANAVLLGSSYEAIALARRGLALLDKLPEGADRDRHELALRITLGGPLTLTSFGSPDVRSNYARARELCAKLGDTTQLPPALWGLWLSDLAGAKLPAARELAGEILQIAGQQQDPVRLVAAHWAMGTTLGNLGEIVDAKSHFERGIALYDARQHDYYATVYGFDPGVACRVELGGRFLWLLGYPEEALRIIHEAQNLARLLAHAPSACFALTFEALLHHLRGDPAKCLECADQVLGNGSSPANLRAWATLCRGWSLTVSGELEAGVKLIHDSLAAHEAIGSPMGRPHFLAVLAEALGRAGNVAAGLAALGDAFDLLKSTGQRYYEAELARLSGELFLKSSEVKTAENYFEDALRIARRQQARSLELRAAMSLSRLWRSQGKVKEADALLAAVYANLSP